MRVNTVSHELLAPLRCIFSFAEFISSRSHKPNEVRDYAQMIKVTSKFLIASSSDLLDSQMLLTGKFKVNIENQDICELVRETA
jgi:signal transduction histidine kinase